MVLSEKPGEKGKTSQEKVKKSDQKVERSEKFSIFRLKIHICNLKIHICSLKIYIFKLKIEFSSDVSNFSDGHKELSLGRTQVFLPAIPSRHPDLLFPSSRPSLPVIPTEVEGSLDKLKRTCKEARSDVGMFINT